MDKFMQIVSWLVGILGLSGGGILFYKSKKKSEDARAREASVKSDLAEADAYIKRIKNLSEEVKEISEETRSVRKELTETREELQKTKEELMEANALIRQLKMNKDEMELQNRLLIQENTELKKANSNLRMQVGKLRKSNQAQEE